MYKPKDHFNVCWLNTVPLTQRKPLTGEHWAVEDGWCVRADKH